MQPLIAVVGPTASGKSDLAVALAARLGGEVVNGDAFQVYRGMDVGTAKTPVAERGGVPHHLLDVVEPDHVGTVAEFQTWARDAIDDCRARDVVPVLAGGSSLYVRAVIDEFSFPGTDERVRARWTAELERVGPEALHAVLAAENPAAAAQILPSNGRRIVRALEVGEITGEPFVATLPDHAAHYDDVVMIGLHVPREVLDDRIAQRVDRMWDAGLVDEVRSLHDRLGVTARRALGYQQVLAFLDGEVTEQQARELTVTGTRKFARRQQRWFTKDPRVVWLAHDDPDLLERALALVLDRRLDT